MDAVDALKEDLLQNLRARVWRAGHRLPTERALGAQYGVGRSTVRRVLLDFKRRGLITQTVGSGTYVSERVSEALVALTPAPPAHTVSPAELMSARFLLEPALIDMVTGNATAADFARMHECNLHAEAAVTLEEFERWDAALHEAIAEAAHNGFVSRIFRLMSEVRAQAEWGVLKRRSATPERRREYEAEHRELVDALRERDAPRARALCLAHLVHVRTNLLGY